jgi:hypothetical protein
VTRRQRVLSYVAVGTLAGLLLAMLAVTLLTRTQWGHEQARRFAVRWIEERVTGELHIGRITGRGLLGGVTVHDFAVVDERGRAFLSVDSARFAYGWRTLLAGDIVLDHVTLYRPTFNVERLPGDEKWNYQRVFVEGEPPAPDARRALILFRRARVVDGTFNVRTPWEPGPGETAGTTRTLVERVPGGMVSVLRFEDVRADFGRVLVQSPIEEGMLFEVRALSTIGYLWEDPFDLRHLRATVTMRDSVLSFDAPEIQLPASRASGIGQIVIGEDELRPDVRLQSPRLYFRDLQWLYPPLPFEGGGSLTLRIQAVPPGGTLWLAEDARLAAPGTRIAGSIGIVTGDTLYFTEVQLRADPLNLDLIESLLPGTLPVDGLLVGTVEVRGPVSGLEVSGDVSYASAAGVHGGRVRWSGTFDARGPYAASRLRADLFDVDLDLLARYRPDLRLTGSVSGRIDAAGRLDRDVRFTSAVVHNASDGSHSRLAGGGSVRRDGGGAQLDLSFDTEVAVADFLEGVELLERLDPQIVGPVRVHGHTDSLRIDATFTTAGGPITVEALVGGSDPPRFTGFGDFADFRLDALLPQLPETGISGRFAFDFLRNGQLEGWFGAEAQRGAIAGVPLLAAGVAGTLRDGRLLVDSVDFQVEGLHIGGSGALGIEPGTTGQLLLTASSADLTAFETRFFGERDLLEEPRLAGRLDASARLSGRVSAFDFEADAIMDRLVLGDLSAARLRLSAGGGDIGAGGSVDVTVAIDSLAGRGLELTAVEAAFAGSGGTTRFELAGHHDDDAVLLLDGAVVRLHDHITVGVSTLSIGNGSGGWEMLGPGVASIDGRVLDVDTFRLVRRDGRGAATAFGRLAWRADDAAPDAALPLDFALRLQRVPLGEFLRIAGVHADMDATLDADVEVTGTAGDPEVRIGLILDEPRFGDARLQLGEAAFRYSGRRLEGSIDAFDRGRNVLQVEGRLPLDLTFGDVTDRQIDEEASITAHFRGFPLAPLLGMVEGFRDIEGDIEGVLTSRGSTRDLTFDGTLALSNGGAFWDATGLRYRDAGGTFRMGQDRIVHVDARARAVDPRARAGRPVANGSAGFVVAEGTVDFAQPADPEFDLAVRASEFYAARRRDADLFVTADARLRGRYTRPVVTGVLRIDRGTLFLEEIYRQTLVVDLGDPLFFDALDAETRALLEEVGPAPQNPFLRNLLVQNVRTTVGPGAWLRGRDINVEVSGDLTIVSFDRREEELRLSGALQVLRGTYQLYYPPFARRFDVQDGIIEFPGTPGFDPGMSISAVYRAKSVLGDPLDILAAVSGTLESPRVRLYSSAQPPISESDLASYLFFGAPTSAIADLGGSGGAGFGEFGLRTFGPSALGYVASGLQSLAQSTGLIDYIGLSSTDALPGQTASAGIGSVFADAQLEVGLYISPRAFLAFSKRLNQNTDLGVRLEWRVDPYTAELFAEDRFARTPGFGASQISEARKTFGFFLFREWGF